MKKEKISLFQLLIFAGFAPLIILSSLAVSIILPSAVIIVYAWLNNNQQDIVSFANTVAEPAALFGTVGLSLLISCKKHKEVSSFSWSLCSGISSSLGLICAAFWTADVDLWVIVSAAVVPVTTILFWKIRTFNVVA